MAELEFYQDRRLRRRAKVEGGLATVGRDPGNTVVFPDTDVSRQHFTLSCRQGHWFVTTHSRFGTQIAGEHRKEQEETEIFDRNTIRFGEWIAVLCLTEEEAERCGLPPRRRTSTDPRCMAIRRP